MSWSELLAPTSVHHLRSGARLVVLDRPGLRNAICLSQLRGGSRSDPPGAAGTAHLTEHLLVQGLAPDGERWVTPVVAAGGDLSATTHPDYLEFCFEGPPAALGTGLAAERERLAGWPLLREGTLATQRDGVCREIEQHVARPTRSLPWPDLGLRLFGSWADGHDPFGEVEQVRGLDLEDCRRFSVEQHHPDAWVIVVLADLSEIDVDLLQSLESAHGDHEPGPAHDTEITAQSTDDHDGIVTGPDWSAPHSVGAVGWRTPSVVDDPHGYAGLLAVAACAGRVVNGHGRLGQMVAMDRLHADALTITAIHPQDARADLTQAQRHIEALAEGRTPHPDILDAALRQVRADVGAMLDRPRGLAQLLARGTLLAGDPHAAGSWVDAVEQIDEGGVHAAAARLLQAPAVGIVRRPRAISAIRPSSTAPTTSPCTRETAPVHLLAVERPTLTAAVCARVARIPAPQISKLRSHGYRVVRDVAGWLVSRTAPGRADDLVATAGAALAGLETRHATVVGTRASSAEPWLVGHSEDGPEASPDRGLEVLPPEELPHGVAAAHLRWPVDTDAVLPRWLGIALLADIQARSHGADPHPLSAPPGTAMSLRQEAVPGDRSLVFEVWAAPDRLPSAIIHLAAELGPDRLRERARAVPDTAQSLAGQWLRDECDGVTLARRATSLLDLGAADDDVRGFDTRLREISADAVVDRILRDTSGAPRGWIRTAEPDLVEGAELPWLTVVR